MTDNHDAKVAAAKAAAAWGGTGLSYWLQQLGFNSWGDVAAFLAAIYSLMLICEWVWKRSRGRSRR